MSQLAAIDRIQLIRTRLQTSLTPIAIHIVDESHLHANHPGAKSGGGHFNLEIVSNAFDEKSQIERHRMIYSALGDAIGKDIHALSIKAKAPSETTYEENH
jgi:BolA protein